MRGGKELGRLRVQPDTKDELNPSLSGPCPQDDVHARTRKCIRDHANSTDWLLLADTDEYIYAEHDGLARDALSNVLEELERAGAHGLLVPWTMMYGEGLTLESQLDPRGGMLRSFPRVLSVAQVTKPMGCLLT